MAMAISMTLASNTAPFTTFDNTTEALLWSSVFGTDNSDARAPDGSNINDAEDPHSASIILPVTLYLGRRRR